MFKLRFSIQTNLGRGIFFNFFYFLSSSRFLIIFISVASRVCRPYPRPLQMQSRRQVSTYSLLLSFFPPCPSRDDVIGAIGSRTYRFTIVVFFPFIRSLACNPRGAFLVISRPGATIKTQRSSENDIHLKITHDPSRLWFAKAWRL